jgi:hypothetical protein
MVFMAMNKIGGTDIVRSRILDQFTRSSGAESRNGGQVDAEGAGTTRRAAPADRLELSDHARRLEGMKRTFDAGRLALESVPDLREARIAQARSRLATGYYDTPEVRGEVAARLGEVMKRLDALL